MLHYIALRRVYRDDVRERASAGDDTTPIFQGPVDTSPRPVLFLPHLFIRADKAFSDYLCLKGAPFLGTEGTARILGKPGLTLLVHQ